MHWLTGIPRVLLCNFMDTPDLILIFFEISGMFSFFAVPILLGDITIDFMQMIDVMVDVMVMVTGEEGEGDGNNNNNNNNNGEGAEGMCESEGNNNNCNNNNNRSVLLLGQIFL